MFGISGGPYRYHSTSHFDDCRRFRVLSIIGNAAQVIQNITARHEATKVPDCN